MKGKLWKRILALVLAGSVMLGDSAIGFAADKQEIGQQILWEEPISFVSNLNEIELKVTQDIDIELQSDTLESIIDGSTTLDANTDGGKNESAWSNYNNSQAGDNTAEIVFEYATQQSISEVVIYFWRDGFSAEYPDVGTTEIYVSEDGSMWTKLETIEKLGQEIENVKDYTYVFDCVTTRFIKLAITNSSVQKNAKTCTGIVEVQFDSENSESNINHVLNATLSASSVEENLESLTAEKAGDGDIETRWSSDSLASSADGAMQWLKATFADVTKIKKIIVKFHVRNIDPSPNNVSSFSIKYVDSNDELKVAKEKCIVPTSLEGYDAEVSIVLDEVIWAKSIQLCDFMVKIGSTQWNSIGITELEAYSENNEILPGTNLALGKTATANGSEVSSLGPEKAVDGDLTSSKSRWSSPEDDGPHWLQIDLGDVYDVRTVRILWEARKATSYRIQTSNDAVVWNDAKVIENRPDKTDDIIILDEPRNTRYVRLYIDDFTAEDPDGNHVTWNTVSVYEMEIYSDIYQSNVNENNKVYATQTFIDAHANFVQENGVFETMLSQYDLSTIFKVRGYEELKDDYTAWNVARFNIFENPYDLVLADWILSETSAESQMEVCNMTIADNQRKIIKNVLSMIEGKVDITEQEKTLIQKMFENSGYDDVAYQICEDVFKNKLKEEDIKALFLTYDTSTKYMEILDKGENIVNSMIDVMNYCSVLDAYNDTNEQFKIVLLDMYNWCMAKKENPFLASAIKRYLETDNSDDVRSKIMQKVVGEGIKAGADIFGEQLVNRTYKFIVKNMDLSGVAVDVATNVTAVLKGMKIGYDIGVAFDNAVFNSDSTAQAYVLAHASVEAAEVLREVLEVRAVNLRENPTAENAVIFCETFSIYRNSQMDIADKVITYLSENNQAFITRIVDRVIGDKSYVTDSYRWLVRKANWQKRNCHNENDVIIDNMKRVLVACPVDVKMYDQDNNLILSIVDDEIEYIGENVAATVRNGIKYIVIFDEDYSIEIEAEEEGMMTYSVSSCDALGNVLESVHYKNIDITQGQIFTGNLYSESAVDGERYVLKSNGKEVDSEACYVAKTDEISISEIVLDVQEMSMNLGDEVEIKYQVLPKDASLEVVTWYSEEETIAKVDEYGKVTAVGCGITNIVCQTLDGRIESKCKVVVENEEANDFDINRLYGSTRYETSYAIASALKEQLGVERFDTVILANGNNFPDALAGSYLASVKDAPILMVRENHKDSLHEFIKNNLNVGGTIYVLGGTGAVPDSVLNGLSGYKVKRLSGQTRYETNLLILEEAGVTNEDILVCTGNAFADSLSASAVGKPILLLNNKKITEEQKAFLEEHVGNRYYIIGGTGAVNQEMENEIAKYGSVERVYGLTRYETSIRVAEKFFDNPEDIVLAYAKNFPDGLCGGPLANKMNAPLILTAEGKIEAAEEYVRENNIHSGKVLGGDGVLPNEAIKEIFHLPEDTKI